MPPPNHYRFSLRITKQQSDAWRAAADRKGLTYRDWARQALDAAAIPPAPSPTLQDIIAKRQAEYRRAGHAKNCGCGWCLSEGGSGGTPLTHLP